MTTTGPELWAERLMGNYGIPPLTFVRGSGTELFDDAGHRYLDFLCGLAVTGLGHAHPRVAAAVAEQASTLIHVSNLFVTEPQLEVAERLDRLVRSGTDQDQPGRVLFQNSGAEANEAALKLVRKFHGRGRHGVLSAFRSFHGRTLATLAATGQPEKHEPFQPLPEGFRHAAWNDVAAFEAALDPSVGAILLEPLQRAREGSIRPRRASYETSGGYATNGASCWSWTRSRPAWDGPGPGSASTTPASGPMW
ncbi:MAG: hypothetical protein Ct9H300mP12_00700 [Acidimicrobiales bacterium]|nr:MAG: hypothetical protein Ct9H300mP12_00700 [Acidimicrobiales bacterium]